MPKIKKRIGENIPSRRVLIVNTVLDVLVIAILIRSIILRNFDNAFVCLLTLLLFGVPRFVTRTLRIRLPETLEIIVLFFIFGAEILGELGNYYQNFPHWDILLHTTWGFLCAALGFSLVDILNRTERIRLNLSPLFVAIVAFCFSMTIGVLWEFFEFGADRIFMTDMQKDTVINAISTTVPEIAGNGGKATVIRDISSVAVNGNTLPIDGYLDIGLYDTIEDMFVNFIGAVVFSVIGYFYIKHRRDGSTAGKFAERFIPVVSDDENTEIAQSADNASADDDNSN